MKVVVPFTARHLDTLAGAPDNAEWHYVGNDDQAYWRVLCEVWNNGEDLVIIEHDVVCRPDVIEAFDECLEPWCLNKYHDMCHDACSEAWRNALGCTRFRARLQAAVPDAVLSIEERHRHWTVVCDGLGANLRAARYTHHWHGTVHHHHMDISHLSSIVGTS